MDISNRIDIEEVYIKTLKTTNIPFPRLKNFNRYGKMKSKICYTERLMVMELKLPRLKFLKNREDLNNDRSI